MGEVVLKAIKEFAKVRRGASPRPIENPKFFGGNVGWVRISDVSASKKYLKQTEDYLSELGEQFSVRVDKGDLVYSIAGSIGKPIIIDMPACIHDGFVQIYNLKNADPEFLYYFLQSIEATLYRFGQAGTQINLNSTIVGDLKVPYYPLTEQTRIAQILSKADEAIAHTEALIAKYQRIKTGLMQDLLTRGIDEKGNIRSEETHSFKDSPLGRIPAEWEYVSIGDVIEYIGSGVTPKGGSTVYQKSGIMLIRSQNVYPNAFDLDDVAFISEEINATMGRSEIFPYDVLLNITGASIGRCTFVPVNFPRANVNQHVCAIRLKNKNLAKAIFLSTFLNSDFGQNQVIRFNSGGNREGLNYSQIKSMTLPYPTNEDEFARIADKLTVTSNYLEHLDSNLAKLQSLKRGLMQDLLSGPREAVENP